MSVAEEIIGVVASRFTAGAAVAARPGRPEQRRGLGDVGQARDECVGILERVAW